MFCFRACTWSTTQSSSPRHTPGPSSSSAWWATTSSARPTIRRTCSGARRVSATSGAASQPSSSARIVQLTAVFIRASCSRQASGAPHVTLTTQETCWVRWRTAWHAAAGTCCPISTSSTWPSCCCTAVSVMSTAAVASTARTGNATRTLCLTAYCLESSRRRTEIYCLPSRNFTELCVGMHIFLSVLILNQNYFSSSLDLVQVNLSTSFHVICFYLDFQAHAGNCDINWLIFAMVLWPICKVCVCVHVCVSLRSIQYESRHFYEFRKNPWVVPKRSPNSPIQLCVRVSFIKTLSARTVFKMQRLKWCLLMSFSYYNFCKWELLIKYALICILQIDLT